MNLVMFSYPLLFFPWILCALFLFFGKKRSVFTVIAAFCAVGALLLSLIFSIPWPEILACLVLILLEAFLCLPKEDAP